MNFVKQQLPLDGKSYRVATCPKDPLRRGMGHLPLAFRQQQVLLYHMDPGSIYALVRTHTVALQTQEKTEMRSGHCPRLIDGEPD